MDEATQNQASAWPVVNVVEFLVAIPWAKEKREYGVLDTKPEDNGSWASARNLVEYYEYRTDDKQALVHTCAIGIVHQRCTAISSPASSHIPEGTAFGQEGKSK